MNTIKLILWLALGSYAACSKVNLTADFATAAGTRANLKGNFDELDLKSDLCFDSVDEVRSRLSGYTGDFTISSMDNLRLRLDLDGSATSKFVLMTSNLDSLFWVSEDSTAKLFGDLTVLGAISGTGATSFPSLSASLPLALNASKQVINGAVTGTGTTQVLSVSPSITGTLAGASSTWSGTLGVTGSTALVGDLTVGNGGTGSTVTVRGATATTAGFQINTSSSTRWFIYKGSATESGSDAGAPFRISAYTDAAAFIDNPIEITRAAGGAITLARPVTHSSTLTQAGLLTAAAGVSITGGSAASGMIYKSAGGGLAMYGVTGSVNDFTISTPGGTALFLNPTGTSNLTVGNSGGTVLIPNLAGTGTRLTTSTSTGVQGNATTIAGAYTWSGAQVLSSTLEVTGIQSNSEAIAFVANGTAGSGRIFRTTSDGLCIRGVSGSVNDLLLEGASGNDVMRSNAATTVVEFPGVGVAITGAATAASLVASGNVTADSLISSKFYEEGTFTATLTGFAANPTGTVYYVRVGKLVQLSFPVLSGTSNATTMTVTGLPTALRPSRAQDMTISAVSDNGNVYAGDLYLQTSGTFQVYFRNSLSAQPSNVYTSSGTKGIQEASVAYSLR